MVGGMCRHLQSIRLMKRDNGWIHRLLEQADNERFHLMVWVDMKKPGKMMRMAILLGQGVWLGSYFMTYLIAPKYCLLSPLCRVFRRLASRCLWGTDRVGRKARFGS